MQYYKYQVRETIFKIQNVEQAKKLDLCFLRQTYISEK